MRASRRGAFTLLELVVAVGVSGALASVAVVNYLGYVEKARVARAIAEIKSIGRVIEAQMVDDDAEYPETLADIDAGNMIDPWGNPYEYLRIAGALVGGVGSRRGGLPDVAAAAAGAGNGGGGSGGGSIMGQVRKDRFLVPINTDFDLYSRGADGQSRPQLDNRVSLDDVVRARDGGYVGLAELF